MKTYKLSFGNVTILKNNLAEVIVDEGVVMDEVMVDEYHDFLLTNLQAPFSLLISKKNSYSYTFKAQQIIVNLKEINAMAVYAGTYGSTLSTETLIKVNEDSHWNIKLFDCREEALKWLETQ